MQRNNKQIKFAEIHDHFSIRKLSVGACSVLLAATLWGVNSAAPVKADVNSNSNEVTKVNDNSQQTSSTKNQNTNQPEQENKDEQTLKVATKSVATDKDTLKEVISDNKAQAPDQEEDSDEQKIENALDQIKPVTIKQTIVYHKPGMAESSTTFSVFI